MHYLQECMSEITKMRKFYESVGNLIPIDLDREQYGELLNLKSLYEQMAHKLSRLELEPEFKTSVLIICDDIRSCFNRVIKAHGKDASKSELIRQLSGHNITHEIQVEQLETIQELIDQEFRNNN